MGNHMCFTDTYNSNTLTFYTHSYQLLESMLSQNSSKLNLICVCQYPDLVVMIGIASFSKYSFYLVLFYFVFEIIG